jgi:hypothetical protein
MDSLSVNINMSFQQIIDMIKQLSPSEKLKINDVLWSGNTEIPDEQKNIVVSLMDAYLRDFQAKKTYTL